MTNLSELLPAGGGGKQAEFAATGTIPSGIAVALNSNGTISVIDPDGYPPTKGTTSVFESASTSSISSCYAPDNKVFIVYQDNANSGYPTAVLGSISGKTITFDSPVVLKSSAGTGQTAAAYSVSNSRAVAFYQVSDGDKRIYGRTSLTSSSLSFSGEYLVVGNGYNQNFSDIYASYDPSAANVVVTYRWAYPYYTQYVEAATVNSNGALTFGTNFQLGTQNGGDVAWGLTYDSLNSRTIIVFYNGSIKMRAMNVSSNRNISFGSEYTTSVSGYTPTLTYDESQNRIVMNYSAAASPYHDHIVAFAFNGSTFTQGTPVDTSLNASFLAYDSDSNKIGIFGRDIYSAGYPGQSKFKVATLSGSTITLSSSVVLVEGASGTTNRNIVYNPLSKVFVLSYTNTSVTHGTSVAVDSGQSNNIDYVGISDAAISNSATGSITLRGGVSTNLSSLTPNSTYYVQTDGTITATVSAAIAGKALSSTSLLLKG